MYISRGQNVSLIWQDKVSSTSITPYEDGKDVREKHFRQRTVRGENSIKNFD